MTKSRGINAPKAVWTDEQVETTIMDVVYQNGAVQPRLFSEAEL